MNLLEKLFAKLVSNLPELAVGAAEPRLEGSRWSCCRTAKGWLHPSHHRTLQPVELGPSCRAPAPHSSHHNCQARLQLQRGYATERAGSCSAPACTPAPDSKDLRSICSPNNTSNTQETSSYYSKQIPPSSNTKPPPSHSKGIECLLWHFWPLLSWVHLLL